ncbi:MAG: M48 family metalloprotease, partial [Phycicoccus sp.]
MTGIALAALALLLAAGAPRAMAPRTRFRHVPRAALVAWQSVTVAGVVAALTAAPAVWSTLADGADLRANAVPLAVVGLVTGVVFVRLLVSGHRVGTRLRVLRARHRTIVDVVGRHDRDRDHVRVVSHPAPTAYCIPGWRSRVVLSQGVLDTLPDDELAAVLAHEDAHLRARHDLLLEFFTVAH